MVQGWKGDHQGHSQAAKRGWAKRNKDKPKRRIRTSDSGRYPDAFEQWYKRWLESGGYEKADEIILNMKEEEEIKTLAEGERRLRKMLYIQWIAESKE